MIEKTDISEMLDGDDEITLIELSQAQYDAYKSEAEALDVNTHEYIELALKHEQMALSVNSKAIPEIEPDSSERFDEKSPQTPLNSHIKRFLKGI